MVMVTIANTTNHLLIEAGMQIFYQSETALH